MARSKYGNRKVQLDGYVFDSQAEANRYCDLKLLECNGDIEGLEVHPKYLLQEGFRDCKGTWVPPITYAADFRYVEGGQSVVEDVKGVQTEAFRLKRALFLRRYGLPLLIVEA